MHKSSYTIYHSYSSLSMEKLCYINLKYSITLCCIILYLRLNVYAMKNGLSNHIFRDIKL